MTYDLHFHPDALKEWKKLSKDIQSQFKKVLKRRLDNPHINSAKLHGNLKDCYKIKLLSSGYRLVYEVKDKELILVVIVIGKRDKSLAYDTAASRR